MPDLADEIFDGAADAYKSGTEYTGNDGASDVDDAEQSEPEKQDVDLEGQGEDERQPGTPDEKDAEEKEVQEDKEQKVEGDGKKKREGAKEAREWGEGWKATAESHELKLKDAEPILKAVEENFGGIANLEFAAELYGALTDEQFDANDAWEWFGENFPENAEKMVQHVAKEIVEKATANAIKRTFGRELNGEEISAITDFLAAGKPANREEFSKFFKESDIPDSLKYDSEGNEIPTATVDYMRRQQQLLQQTQEKLQQLEGRVSGAETEQQESVAAKAVESYVGENFKAVNDKITELGLDKALEGETDDIREFRETIAGMFEAVTLSFVAKDKTFQGMYQKALSSVAKAAVSKGKDRHAKANADDYSRRIRAKVSSAAAKTAELLSPLIDSLAAKRGGQVEKVTTKAKPVPKNSAGDVKPKPATSDKASYEIDPFDDVGEVVGDMRRRGVLKTL